MSEKTHAALKAFEEFGLEYRLSQTAEYRRRVAERYPHDAARSERAIELLNILAGQEPSTKAMMALNDAILTYDSWCEGRVFDSDPPPFATRVSASLSSIGFSWLPNNIDEVVSVLATDATLSMDGDREA